MFVLSLGAALILACATGDITCPVFALLILSLVSGEQVLPILAALIFARVSSDGLAQPPSPPSVRFLRHPVPKSLRPHASIWYLS